MSHVSRSPILMFGAWCGVFYMAALLLGWCVFAGMLPPMAPTMSAVDVQRFFAADTTFIRIGMIIVMYSALLFMIFAATLAHFLNRAEGGVGVLSYLALLGGCGNMVLTFYPAIWWLVAAYRPERTPELIALMNDMSWLQFVGGVSIYDALPLAVAIAAFTDRSPTPVFPRWLGYFNVMVILGLLPDQLLFFFHEGPFAWNGLFGLWIPLILFGSWFLVHFWVMRGVLLRERGTSPASDGPVPVSGNPD